MVQCTDCHTPHGGFGTRQLPGDRCPGRRLHQVPLRKAGPFVARHTTRSKPRGRVSCHSPHGSANPRLLKRSQVNLLCLECHALTVGYRSSGYSDLPQPGAELSGMHVVSRRDSWVELRPLLDQVGEHGKSNQNPTISVGSPRPAWMFSALVALPFFVFLAPRRGRSQRDEDDQDQFRKLQTQAVVRNSAIASPTSPATSRPSIPS